MMFGWGCDVGLLSGRGERTEGAMIGRAESREAGILVVRASPLVRLFPFLSCFVVGGPVDALSQLETLSGSGTKRNDEAASSRNAKSLLSGFDLPILQGAGYLAFALSRRQCQMSNGLCPQPRNGVTSGGRDGQASNRQGGIGSGKWHQAVQREGPGRDRAPFCSGCPCGIAAGARSRLASAV